MKTFLIAGATFLAGVVIGYLLNLRTVTVWHNRVRDLRAGKPRFTVQSVTRFIFLTAQVFAIIWVSWSYIIATYSTVVLGQPFPAEELSKEAVRTIIGVGALKVFENIFEHNEGPVFGTSKKNNDPLDADTEEGVG